MHNVKIENGIRGRITYTFGITKRVRIESPTEFHCHRVFLSENDGEDTESWFMKYLNV